MSIWVNGWRLGTLTIDGDRTTRRTTAIVQRIIGIIILIIGEGLREHFKDGSGLIVWYLDVGDVEEAIE